MSDATWKGAPEKESWSTEYEKLFSTLKEKLTAKPKVQLSDLSLLMPATLGQVVLFSKKRGLTLTPNILFPVAYASWKLNVAEQNYSIVEK